MNCKEFCFLGENMQCQGFCILLEDKCKGLAFCGRTCIAKEFVGEHALQRILWANMHYKGFAFCGRTGIAKEFVGEHALQRICILWDNRNCKGGCVLCKGKVHARIFDVVASV